MKYLILLLWTLPAFSQTLDATWSTSERADGYKFYWGIESRNYTHSQTVYKTKVHVPLSWFEREKVYYFAVTAFNYIDESDFSDEASAFITTGIEENVINFKECDEVKTYNVLGQQVKSDRSQLPSGFYIRRCFVGDKVVWIKSEVLMK